MQANNIPPATSLGKCCAKYILEYPINTAYKNPTATIHFLLIIKQANKKNTNACVVWPDGKLDTVCISTPVTVCIELRLAIALMGLGSLGINQNLQDSTNISEIIKERNNNGKYLFLKK